MIFICLFLFKSYPTAADTCSDGNCTNGQGIAIFTNDGKYIRHVYAWDGAFPEMEQKNQPKYKYVGEFKNGFPEGHGEMTGEGNDGSKYIGEFKNGYFEGQGSYTNHSADHSVDQKFGDWKQSYAGEWRKSLQNGQGILVTGYEKLGLDKYIGEFKQGKYEGQGVLYTKGNKYVGEFKDGKYVETSLTETQKEAIGQTAITILKIFGHFL